MAAGQPLNCQYRHLSNESATSRRYRLKTEREKRAE